MTFVVVRQIQQSSVSRSLLCLLDSGATTSWIHCQALLKGCHGQTVNSNTNGTMPEPLHPIKQFFSMKLPSQSSVH